ncbi:Protein ZBED8 [Chionoecetes opilio]|uniref:Protein ZBED8 n=1 Tax=Chionoecetes opilio TaxID=41210 RepID=A0A8J4XLI3_CHIOP|nr:Protein ZBED8 [Chionoecetes opilio]
MNQEVVEATCQCLLAQADKAEGAVVSAAQLEQTVISEFSRCLMQIIGSYTSRSRDFAMSKKRKYLDSYVQYGFDFVVVDGLEKPQCLLCSKVLGNGSLKPSLLKQHREATHPAHASDDRAKFEAKRARFRAAGTLPKLGLVSEKKSMLAASYNVVQRIAKAKTPHDIAEKLIEPWP